MTTSPAPAPAPAPTPYATALAEYATRATMRLNVPGHQARGGAPDPLVNFFGQRILDLDIPPLLDGIDKSTAGHDDNPMAQALDLATTTFRAARVWFLTNGASQANRIAQLALGQYRNVDDPVVAQRSAHSSFIDGVILAGTQPVFVQPTICETHGINHGVTVDALSSTLDAHPHAKAAYVVSPSYFGAVADVEGMAALAHARGMPLIVDAAWGAHFGFHPDVPANPLDLGADLVVSSTHKLGGSLTQSAMLLLGDTDYARELEPLIERAFVLTQSTSASGLLLASLDLARAWLSRAHDPISHAIVAADELRVALRAAGYAIVSDDFGDFTDIVSHDPLHVSIDVRSTRLTGHAVRERLMSEHDIYTEISTESCLVAIVAPGHDVDVERFVGAINTLRDSSRRDSSHRDTRALATTVVVPTLTLPTPGASVMRPREAYFATHEVVSAMDAVGRVSADTLAAYPPGIPNVLPGEVITRETVAFLQGVARIPGGYVRGASDPQVTHFRVVA